MYYNRKYLQFNEFVFDSYDMLTNADFGAVSTKITSNELGYGNGDFVSLNGEYSNFKSYSISMSVSIELTKIGCENRKYYLDFAISELSKSGKLWAIQNNEIIWAYAVPTSIAWGALSCEDLATIELDLLIYEGVWHKADKTKTYLSKFDLCTFIDCMNYIDNNPCFENQEFENCCDPTICNSDGTTISNNGEELCCCDCMNIDKTDSLCYVSHETLQSFYNKCTNDHKIIYDCEKAVEYFTTCVNTRLGKRFCSSNGNIYAKMFVSTNIPTTGYEICIHGQMENPYLEINGTGFIIVGEYDGYLTLFGNGEVRFDKGDRHCYDIIEPSDILLHKYGDNMQSGFNFTFMPRYNKIKIETGGCSAACAYIQVDEKTI